jgi:hypothetical protein
MNDRGRTIIRGSAGWTAVNERFAAGGRTVEEALSNFWHMVESTDAELQGPMTLAENTGPLTAQTARQP